MHLVTPGAVRGWHPGAVAARLFSVRDRRSLCAVLTAGLTHARVDQLVAAHPIPGDPGHDAGKAGRVGLYVATVLAAADHGPLVGALAMIDPEKAAPGIRAPLEQLRAKAGLTEPPVSPPLPAPEAGVAASDTAELEDVDVAAIEDPPATLEAAGEEGSASVLVVVLEQLDVQQAQVQVVMHALMHAGVQVVVSGQGAVPEGALVLRPAGVG